MTRLSAVELFFFAFESTSHPWHMGGVLLFDPAEGQTGAELAHQTMAALTETAPNAPWNQRPVLGIGSLPHWESVREIDFGHHLRRIALPAPGSLSQLMDVVSGLYPELLDRSRPLWQVYLIDGLEHDRIALFFKTHHALTSGMAGRRMLSDWLQESPQDCPRALWAAAAEPQPQPETTDRGGGLSVIGAARRIGGLAKVGPGIVKAAAQIVKVLPEEVRLVRDTGLPFSAARTPRMTAHMSSARSFAAFDLPLGEARQIRERAGGTVNDVLMTVCDEAMQRYLAESGGHRDQPMTAMLAMSTRPGDGSAGNAALTAIVVKLGAPQASPAERFTQVVAATTRAKSVVRQTSQTTLQLQMLLQGAAELREQLPFGRGSVPNIVNFALSNIQGGLQEPRYLGKAKLAAAYATPIVPPSHGVNFTAMPCGDSLCVGVGAVRNFVPDTNRLAELATQAFEELKATVLTPAGDRRTKSPSPARSGT